jgi:hypothetical protein
VEEMAECYLREVRLLQPEGPYFLAGFCMGGMVAFEMARRLQLEGQTIGLVALLESHGPGYFISPRHHIEFFYEERTLAQRIREYLRQLREATPEQRRFLLWRKAAQIRNGALAPAIRLIAQTTTPHSADALYAARPFAGILFRCREAARRLCDDPRDSAVSRAMSKSTNSWLSRHLVPRTNVSVLAEKLKACGEGKPPVTLIDETLRLLLSASGAMTVGSGDWWRRLRRRDCAHQPCCRGALPHHTRLTRIGGAKVEHRRVPTADRSHACRGGLRRKLVPVLVTLAAARKRAFRESCLLTTFTVAPLWSRPRRSHERSDSGLWLVTSLLAGSSLCRQQCLLSGMYCSVADHSGYRYKITRTQRLLVGHLRALTDIKS